MNRFFSVLSVIFIFTAVANSVSAVYGRAAIDSVVSRNNRKLSRSPEIGRSPAPASGVVNVLFIKVQFQIDTNDKTSGNGQFPYKVWGPTADNTTNYFQDRINKVIKYYNEVSGGSITMTGDIKGPVTLDKKMEDYLPDLASANKETHKTILADTIAKMTGVSFSKYHIVCLIHAGAGGELGIGDDVKDIYSVFESFQTPVQASDGTNIYAFALVPETQCNDSMFTVANSSNPTPDQYAASLNKDLEFSNVLIPKYWDVTGTWVHEIAHAFGLADLYNANPSSIGVTLHDWSLMGHGSYLPFPETDQTDAQNIIPHSSDEIPYSSVPSHLDAWSKMQLGWANIKEVSTVSTVTITAQQYTSGRKSDIYKLWTDGNIPTVSDFQNNHGEYFLIENRAQLGFDEYIPESGLMIYHIDDSVGIIENNNLQQDNIQPRVLPLSADNIYEIVSKSADTSYDRAPVLNTVFPGTETVVRTLNDSTSPSTMKYNGGKSWVSLSNITQILNNISLTISVSSPGVITLISPQNSSTIFGSMPVISANIGSLLNPSISIDGTIILSSVSNGVITAQPSLPLSVGPHTFVISGKDVLTGNTVTSNYNFNIIQKTVSAGIKMFSIPVAGIGSAATVFPNSSLVNKLCKYDPITKIYTYYPNFDFNENSNIAKLYSGKTVDYSLKAPAGMGFWLKLDSNTNLTLNGDSLPADASIYIRMDPGFNMVGNPFSQPVYLSTCLIELSGINYTFANAVSRGYVSQMVYSFDGSQYSAVDFSNVVLQPWAAYWIKTTANVKLVITPSSNRRIESALPSRHITNNWSFKVNVKNVENNGGAEFTLGVAEGATDSYDSGIDIPVPPISPLGVSVSSRSMSNDLMGDFKSVFTTGKEWNFKVKSVSGRNILTVSDIVNIPGKFDAILTDVSSGIKVNLRNSNSYVYSLNSDGDRDFSVTVKKRTNTLLINNLHQNKLRRDDNIYMSWIPSQDGLCIIEIRSISGKLVFTDKINVISGQYTEYNWHGNSYNGTSVPSGTYQFLVRLNANDGRIVKAVATINK